MTEDLADERLREVMPLVETLFGLSTEFVNRYGNFLPHGAFLDVEGNISLCTAAPAQSDVTTATEVLPMLHGAMRQQTAHWTTNAVAVSESVFIGEAKTPAIKVLLEHRDGMTLAFYQPWRKRFLRSPVMGDIQITAADPEVGEWQTPSVAPRDSFRI